jgi:valyl-tRNA synthetase
MTQDNTQNNTQELSSRYEAQSTEKKWYQHWLDKQYFRSTPDEREPYTIVIPPPNITGQLHMGHMLNNTIQDILIRKARLEGKNACWVPGTDHASIATEAKVVALLAEKGIKKSDITRKEFLGHAFEWKEKYGNIILQQLQKLGASCDWSRTRFTMEEKLSRAVQQSFVDLYEKGFIYKGLRMTNWDPQAQTALSNEEVIFSEEQSQLYHIRYEIEGSNGEEFITIATTRPETILADVAIAVHPDDPRHADKVGKFAFVPMLRRRIPIIADTYVKIDFGTGALKITPAHDVNDYEVGKRHSLPVIDMFNADGTLNKTAKFYIGQDRFWVRKQIVKDLQAQEHIVKIENYTNSVGRSERTKAVIEPRLTEQWFLRMAELCGDALAAVENGSVRFLPDHFVNMYRSWLQADNVRDWCISRQLWWGQQIPVFYAPDGRLAVAMTAEKAAQTLGDVKPEDLRQDTDVMDTWFSSWLWPMSVFDAFEENADLTEFRYYYPTNVLVTGWDIMFFWVARMIMAGNTWAAELLGEQLAKEKGIVPFRDVYFTGMVRDKKRRKMSKQLGNSPDALDLIDKYSADGVRFGMLSCSSAGNDVIFDAPEQTTDSKLCETGRNFTNKLWNALRLVKGWPIMPQAASEETAKINALAISWLEQKLSRTIEQLNDSFRAYRLSEAMNTLYSFIWDDFCAWYLEIIKPAYECPIDAPTLAATMDILERVMTLLHPFMPFITEEIWSHLRPREAGDDCIISQWPKAGKYDSEFIDDFERMMQIVSAAREIRNQQQLSPKLLLDLVANDTPAWQKFAKIEGMTACLQKIGNFQSVQISSEEVPQSASILAGTLQLFLCLPEKAIDKDAERNKIQKELEYVQGFIDILQKKLTNERFVQNAKPEVIALEQRKLDDNQTRLQLLQTSLAQLT